MEDLGIPDVVGSDHIFPDTDLALEWAENLLIERITEEAKLTKKIYAIHEIEVFRDLTADQLLQVEKYIHPVSFKKGETIFKQGDMGDGMYFIQSGYVSVIADLRADGRERRLATFAEGVFFGDMAILENEVRSATVRAEIDTKLLFMSKAEFQKLVDQEPLIASTMLLGISRELSYRLRMTNAEVRTLAE